MCCFFNKAYLRVPFDIIKQYKVILLYHCWNHVVFSFIVVKDAASHSTNYSLPRGGGGGAVLKRRTVKQQSGASKSTLVFVKISQ